MVGLKGVSRVRHYSCGSSRRSSILGTERKGKSKMEQKFSALKDKKIEMCF